MSETIKIDMPKVAATSRERVVNKRKALVASNAILNMASWDETEEGEDFWASVCARLEQMAERGW